MSLIEGVGDDVTLFVAILFTVVVLTLAWISTYVSDRSLLNVIVLDRTTFRHLLRRLNLRRHRTAVPVAPSVPPTSEDRRQDTIVEATTQASIESSQSQAASQPDSSTPEAATGTSTDEPQRNDESSAQSLDSDESSARSLESTPERPISPSDGIAVDKSNVEQTECLQDDVPSSEITRDSFGRADTLRHRFGSSSGKSAHSSFGPATETVPQEPTSPVTTETTPGSETTTGDAVGPPAEGGFITIRLKYLNDRQREVQSRSEDTLGEFKRRHFADELADNCTVRLVFQGQELRHENRTLQSYNVRHNCVIHCVLIQAQNPVEQPGQQPAEELDLSVLMLPLFALMLGLIWYCRFMYKNYFNAISTCSLIGITFLFLVGAVAAWRPAAWQDHDD